MKHELSLQQFEQVELMARSNQRLPGEPESAYNAYLVYRGLGPDRDLREAWRVYRERPIEGRKTRGRPRLSNAKPGRPSGQWTMWCSDWNWKERAAVYDGFANHLMDNHGLAAATARQRRIEQKQIATIDMLDNEIRRLDSSLDDLLKGPLTPEKYSLFIDNVKQANGFARLIMCTDWNRTGRTRFQDISGCQHLIGRQPGESMRAYKAFCFYRDQGPQRSLRTAYRLYQQTVKGRSVKGTSAPPRSAGHWPEWSRRWEWAWRAAAYDGVVREIDLYRPDGMKYRLLHFDIADLHRTMQRFQKAGRLLRKILAVMRRPDTDSTMGWGSRLATAAMLRIETAAQAAGNYSHIR